MLILSLFIEPPSLRKEVSPPPHSHVQVCKKYCSGLPFPFPGNLPDPGIEPTSLASPALAGGFFTTRVIWEAQILNTHTQKMITVMQYRCQPMLWLWSFCNMQVFPSNISLFNCISIVSQLKFNYISILN